MRWAIGATVLFFVGVAGCATPHGGLSSPSGWVEVDTAVDLAASYPFDPPPIAFWFVDDEGEATVVQRAFEAREDGLVDLVERYESSGEARTRVALSRLANGDVVIHEIVQHSGDRITRFDPPMLFAPADLLPGETVEQSLRIETFTLDDPPKPNGTGQGSLTLTRAKDRANTSMPDHPWAVLEARLTARVGPATIETVTVYSLEPASATARGGLRERASMRTVRVLGIVLEREREALSELDPRDESTGSVGSADTD
jgi:hypothetical protein